MEKKVLIKLHGIDCNVVVIDSTRVSKSVRYSYGQIYVTCPINTPIFLLKLRLEKMFPKSIVSKFDSDALYNDDYCYILGEKRRIIKPFSFKEAEFKDIIVSSEKELKEKLKKLSKDIITSRVRRYEAIMQTAYHEVKITRMYASRGKNYFKKNLLTFSDELIHFSLEMIDAIVIHELAHDFQQNHSKKFYQIVYNYCSDYDKKIEKLTYGEKK